MKGSKQWWLVEGRTLCEEYMCACGQNVFMYATEVLIEVFANGSNGEVFLDFFMRASPL